MPGRSAALFRKDSSIKYPVTPDGRYFVVRGRLWRTTNPALPDETRRQLTTELMAARRAVGTARRHNDAAQMAAARAAVDAAKIALGERGPVWWHDGAPDYNRYLAKNTPYRAWYASLQSAEQDGQPGLAGNDGSI